MALSSLKKKFHRSYGDVSERNKPAPQRFPGLDRKRLVKVILALVGISFIGGSIMLLVISRDLPDPSNLSERQVAESSKIYDRSGEHVLYEIYQDQKRTIVPLSEINPSPPSTGIKLKQLFCASKLLSSTSTVTYGLTFTSS
jgi:hypothetical protein